MNKIIIALIIIMTLIPITQVNALTEKEYNYEISKLNKLLLEYGYNFTITIPYKESCYYHDDDKYEYEKYQCP